MPTLLVACTHYPLHAHTFLTAVSSRMEALIYKAKLQLHADRAMESLKVCAQATEEGVLGPRDCSVVANAFMHAVGGPRQNCLYLRALAAEQSREGDEEGATISREARDILQQQIRDACETMTAMANRQGSSPCEAFWLRMRADCARYQAEMGRTSPADAASLYERAMSSASQLEAKDANRLGIAMGQAALKADLMNDRQTAAEIARKALDSIQGFKLSARTDRESLYIAQLLRDNVVSWTSFPPDTSDLTV